MKVVLVDAPFDIPKIFGFKRPTKRLVYQPLGIGYLAAGLEQAGHQVSFIDCPALRLNIDEVLQKLEQESPDLVGIPCFVWGRSLVYELVKRISKVHPDLPVVLGGPQITAFAESVFKECPELSIALRGEADISFAEIASRLAHGEPIGDVPGIVLRGNSGDLFYGPPPHVIHDLDQIPFPARHIYQRELYSPMPFMISQPPIPAERLITSRGCHWARCRFCYQSSSSAPCYRRRSPENVVAEIRQLIHNLGAQFLFFTDDDFLRDASWIERFCDCFDKEGFSVKWSAFGRVDTVTESMLKRVAKSGCVHLSYGYESGNQETLDLLRKGTRLEQCRMATRWAKNAGIEVAGFMMFGLPRETPQMAENTIRFAIELDADYILFEPYHVLEGTPLAEIAMQEGRLVERSNENIMLPTYLPNTYESAEQLHKMVRKAYIHYYFRPKYILRALWRARRPGVCRNYVNKLWVGLQIIFFKP